MQLADRMKSYERLYTSGRLMPRLPVCIRVDGRAFHTFCKSMDKPFDIRMEKAMAETARYLLGDLNATVAHTFSDEISLIVAQDGARQEPPFGGKVFRINSVVASMATVMFNRHVTSPNMATFDCRVWQVPNKQEAVNYLIWREQDAARNSVSMVAQAHFSHKQLLGKHSGAMQDMLMETHGINWNDLPDSRRRGTYLRYVPEERTLTDEEWSRIPEARRPARDYTFTRACLRTMCWPRLTTMTSEAAIAAVFDEPQEVHCVEEEQG